MKLDEDGRTAKSNLTIDPLRALAKYFYILNEKKVTLERGGSRTPIYLANIP